MRRRFAEVTTSLLDTDRRVAVVLADISEALFADARRSHPHRVVSLGIREQLLIGVTAGLALEGMRPIAHTYAPFLVERAFEQIKLDLGHQEAGAILVSTGASYDAAREGRTHQAPGDVALIGTLPGWTVHVPGHPQEMEEQLRHAAASDGRVYLRLTERHNAHAWGGSGVTVVRTGARATVLAVGPLLDPVLAACEGLDVNVLYASTIRPFDAEAVLATLARPDVILVEPYLAGTSAALLADALAHVPHRLLALGVPAVELRHYGDPAEHERAHGLDAAGLRRSIVDFLELGAAGDAPTTIEWACSSQAERLR